MAQDSGDIVGDQRPNPIQQVGTPQKPPSVQKEIQKQAKEAVEILPISKTIEEFIEKERADIRDFHSYLKPILVRKSGKQPTADDIAAEFRAREIYLSMLDRFADKVASRTITLEKKIKDAEKAKQI